MFFGSESYAVDTKGRVAFPAKLRKHVSPEANDTFVVTRGVVDSGCLVVYPWDEWKRMAKVTDSLSDFIEDEVVVLRTLFANAQDVTLDAQGRLGIAPRLLEFAGITNEAVIVGVKNHVELWNPARYDAYLAAQKESYGQVAGRVFGAKRG
jgi:MraZ protein